MPQQKQTEGVMGAKRKGTCLLGWIVVAWVILRNSITQELCLTI